MAQVDGSGTPVTTPSRAIPRFRALRFLDAGRKSLFAFPIDRFVL